MLRVVLDTNVFLSGLLSKTGLPGQALHAWREGRYLLAISPSIMIEIRQILESPRIAEKYHVPREDVEQ